MRSDEYNAHDRWDEVSGALVMQGNNKVEGEGLGS